MLAPRNNPCPNLAALGLVVSLMGCGAASTTAPASPSTTSSRAVLFYSDVELAPGRTFPSPLVRGSVNGKPTTIVVDTGAQVSVIDAALAADAKLEIGAPLDGHDPSGTTVAMRRTERPRLAIDGLGPLAERPTAVAALPPIFARLGVGAILSPQTLAESRRSVVMDLARRELRVTDLAPSHDSTSEARRRDLSVVDVCHFQESGMDAKALVVKATIDGTTALFEVDTGASGTFVVAESDVGRKLGARPDASRAQAMGAAGPIDVIRVGRAPAKAGSVALDGPITVMPGEKDGRCGYEGRLGIDRLRSCTLVIGESTASGTCLGDP